jgi:hypothetical protein
MPKKDDKGEPVLDKFKKPVMVDSVKNITAFNEIFKKIDVIARCRPEVI